MTSLLSRPYMRVGLPKIDLSGCVFYAPLWRPDMGGTTFYSKDTYNHLCTPTNATWGSDGRTTAGTGYIRCGTNSVLDWVFPFTLIFYGRNDGGVAHQVILSRLGITVNYSGFFWSINNNAQYVIFGDGTTAIDRAFAGTVSANKTHLALVCTATSIISYINGVATETYVNAQAVTTVAAQQFTLMARSDDLGNKSTGLQKVIMKYNRALTPAEVMNNYLAIKN